MALSNPQLCPPERGAAAALGAVLLGPHKAPAIHAAQHERAGRAGCVGQRGRLYRWPAKEKATASGYGHLTRSRPQDSASTAAAPQWEPRKQLGGRRKAPRQRIGKSTQRGAPTIQSLGDRIAGLYFNQSRMDSQR